MEDWKQRLLDLIAERRLTQTQLEKLAGVGHGMITDILRKNSSPSIKNLIKITSVLGITVGQLIDGDENHTSTVEISGMAQGEVWRPAHGDERRRVPLDVLNSVNMVWIEVSGDHLVPAFRDGDLLGGQRVIPSNLSNQIGKDVIAETVDGNRVIGVLQKGAPKGRYSIRSFDPRRPDLPNVQLAWAAPIQFILRDIA